MAEYKGRRARKRAAGGATGEGHASPPHGHMVVMIALAPGKKPKKPDHVEGASAKKHLGKRARGGAPVRKRADGGATDQDMDGYNAFLQENARQNALDDDKNPSPWSHENRSADKGEPLLYKREFRDAPYTNAGNVPVNKQVPPSPILNRQSGRGPDNGRVPPRGSHEDFNDAAHKFSAVIERTHNEPIRNFDANMQSADIALDRMRGKYGGNTKYPADQPEGYPAPVPQNPAMDTYNAGNAKRARGGRTKRKSGGHVEGAAAHHHMGRRARGGRMLDAREASHDPDQNGLDKVSWGHGTDERAAEMPDREPSSGRGKRR